MLSRAASGVRTRDLWLGKRVLYQLSYCRIPLYHTSKTKSRYPDSNRGPTHYECVALPTEPYRPLLFVEMRCKGIVFFPMLQIYSVFFW